MFHRPTVRNDFRRVLFQKGPRGGQYDYQEPTYLSFIILFDTTSPLLNDNVAEKALRETYGETERADKLKAFKKTLLTLNREMPWYWQSITGVDRVLDIDMTEPYRGGDDALLTIDCNESINFAISGLMDLYRESVYDLYAWTQVLPENYRKFNMWVYISEVRDIQTSKPNGKVGVTEINKEITGDSKSLFAYKFGFCEFQLDSAKETFETLSWSEPTNQTPKINIKYETIERWDANYLQGFDNVNATISPISAERPNVLGDFISSTGDRLTQSFQDSATTFQNNIKRNNPITAAKKRLDNMYEGALREIDETLAGAGRLPGNILKDATAAVDSRANSFAQAVKTNIFGVEGATVGQALQQGSVNAILPTLFPKINSQDGNPKSNLGNIND